MKIDQIYVTGSNMENNAKSILDGTASVNQIETWLNWKGRCNGGEVLEAAAALLLDMVKSPITLLHFSVIKNNDVVLTIGTHSGSKTLQIDNADIKALVNLQSANPPNNRVVLDGPLPQLARD